MTRKRILIAFSFGGIASLCLMMWGGYVLLFHTGIRRALPWNATEIVEYYEGYGILPDFLLCLKARIKEGDFPAYAQRLGLTLYDKEVDGAWEFGTNACDKPWWDPSPSMAGAYLKDRTAEEFYMMAKHENGFVYVIVDRW